MIKRQRQKGAGWGVGRGGMGRKGKNERLGTFLMAN
jgi:hypothetical protein